MVGIRSFPIGFRPIFRGELAVSFREGNSSPLKAMVGWFRRSVFLLRPFVAVKHSMSWPAVETLEKVESIRYHISKLGSSEHIIKWDTKLKKTGWSNHPKESNLDQVGLNEHRIWIYLIDQSHAWQFYGITWQNCVFFKIQSQLNKKNWDHSSSRGNHSCSYMDCSLFLL